MGGHHRLASGGRARAAAIYPFQLCKAILRGFRNQLRSDGRMIQGICGLQSLEWEEARTLQWDELPEASAESLESALTRCSPKRPPELSAGRRRRITTGEQEMESTLARCAQEEEMCVIDMKSRRCHESFRDAITGQASTQHGYAKPERRNWSTLHLKECGIKGQDRRHTNSRGSRPFL